MNKEWYSVSKTIQQTKPRILNKQKLKEHTQGHQAFLKPCHLILAIREDNSPPSRCSWKRQDMALNTPGNAQVSPIREERPPPLMQGQGWRILQQREAYNLAFAVICSVQQSASGHIFLHYFLCMLPHNWRASNKILLNVSDRLLLVVKVLALGWGEDF